MKFSVNPRIFLSCLLAVSVSVFWFQSRPVTVGYERRTIAFEIDGHRISSFKDPCNASNEVADLMTDVLWGNATCAFTNVIDEIVGFMNDVWGQSSCIFIEDLPFPVYERGGQPGRLLVGTHDLGPCVLGRLLASRSLQRPPTSQGSHEQGAQSRLQQPQLQ